MKYVYLNNARNPSITLWYKENGVPTKHIIKYVMLLFLFYSYEVTTGLL